MVRKSFKTYLGSAPCECGSNLRPAFVNEYDATVELGIPAKLVGQVPGLSCDQCGVFVVSMTALQGASESAVEIVLQLDRCLTGKEARFLRKAVLAVSQEGLADKLGMSRPTVARWETSTSLNSSQDFDLRGIVVGHIIKKSRLGGRKKAQGELVQLARSVLGEVRQKRAPKRVKPLRIAA